MSLPAHIAIIMDGNRRWATEQGLPKFTGHTEGAKNLKRIVRSVANRGIKCLTLWALSTENVKNRSEQELRHLFALIKKLPDYLSDFIETNTRMHVIGNLAALPEDVQETLQRMVDDTRAHTGMTLTLAINYGGRDELVRTMQKLIRAGYTEQEITEELLEAHLDTANMPPVDLIIRTAGNQRTSGYLPWQSVYAELYFTHTYWPAFTETDLDAALSWFEEQQRNFGK